MTAGNFAGRDVGDPSGLGAVERFTEIASILARGVVRLIESRQLGSLAVLEESSDFEGKGLEVPGDSRPYGPTG